MFSSFRVRCFLFLAVFCLFLFLFPGCLGPAKSKKVSYSTRFRRRGGVYHTVRRGQTLWRIAKTYGVRLEDIVRANGISDPSKIKVGQRLFIPRATRVLGVKPPLTTKVEKVVKGKFIWPLRGKLISGYSYQSGVKNDGIDIAATAGTDILAAKSGRVIYADNKMQYYGNMIIIKHQGQYFTVYAHNSVSLVSANQWVTQGQVIARVGNTGRASSPRLHFEIRHGEKPVNPLAYLP